MPRLVGYSAMVACLSVVLVGCGSANGTASRPAIVFTFRLSQSDAGTVTRADTDAVMKAMRRRLHALGASGTVTSRGERTIVLRIIGRAARSAVLGRIVGRSTRLELYDLVPALEPPSVSPNGDVQPYRNLYQLLASVQSPGPRAASGYVVFKPTRGGRVYQIAPSGGPARTLHKNPKTGFPGALDRYGGRVPPGWKVLGVPSKTVVVTCSAQTATVCPGDPYGVPAGKGVDYYLFKHGTYRRDRYATDGKYPNMTSADLDASTVRQDFDPSSGQPIVLLSFTDKGNRTFQQVTRNEAVRGAITGQGANCGATCAFAIVLDDEIRSWPAIDPRQNPHGIDPRGSGAEINNIGSLAEAKQLALELQTGGFPVDIAVISVRRVG